MGTGQGQEKLRSSDEASEDPQELGASRPQPAPPPGENLEKIREILFGSNIREYERRFAEIESRLSKELGELKEEARRRLNSLEISASREIEALNSRIEKERQERAEINEKLNRGVLELSSALERKARESEDRSIRMEREFRDEILAQSRSAGEELRNRIEEVISSFERRAAELREQKLDRDALAELLNEIAARLNREPGLPKLETLVHGRSSG